jgi:hypothetical protein
MVRYGHTVSFEYLKETDVEKANDGAVQQAVELEGQPRCTGQKNRTNFHTAA